MLDGRIIEAEVRPNEETCNYSCRRSASANNVDTCFGRICRNGKGLCPGAAQCRNCRRTTNCFGGGATRSPRRKQEQPCLCAKELSDRSARATHKERRAGFSGRDG